MEDAASEVRTAVYLVADELEAIAGEMRGRGRPNGRTLHTANTLELVARRLRARILR